MALMRFLFFLVFFFFTTKGWILYQDTLLRSTFDINHLPGVQRGKKRKKKDDLQCGRMRQNR